MTYNLNDIDMKTMQNYKKMYKLIAHRHYVQEHGKDMPEMLNWKWAAHE